MARPDERIAADIRAFEPVEGDWRALDSLLTEVWEAGGASRYVPDLLSLLERFPDDDGAGVLWSVAHGLEELPGYESAVVQSVQRRPTDFTVTMIGRLLNSGTSEVNGVPLVGLLRSVASSPDVLAGIRRRATRIVSNHSEPAAGNGEPAA